MKFFSSVFTVAALVLSVVSADTTAPNPITNPARDEVLQAGTDYPIKWVKTTEGTVTLNLRKGKPGSLETVSIIVKDAPNTGAYTWSIDKNLPTAEDYAIEIVPEAGLPNYAGPFTIKSNEKPKSTTTGTPTTTASRSSITHSANSTSMNATTLVTTTTKPHNMTSSTIEPTSSGNTTITSFTSKTATKTSVTTTSTSSAKPSETAGAATRVSGAGALMAVAAVAAALVL